MSIVPLLQETASALQVNPLDLATVISYETAGTFDPLKKGPRTQWGRHRGLIQFGEPQAQQYGVDWDRPLESQLGREGAIVRYLTDRGFKPGGSILDLYSTINAGAPGLYDRTDANNGGAPGTVRDKVEQQFGPHRERAARLLGIDVADSGQTMTDAAPQFSRADLLREAMRRGLISRDDLMAEAQRRGLIESAPTGNPPPEGMTAQQAGEAAMAEALDARQLERGREVSTTSRVATSFLEGLPFVGGWMDEAAGAVMGPGARDAMRAASRANAEDAPVLNTLGNVAGGVVGSLPALLAAPAVGAMAPASLAGQALLAGGTGAALGAAEGAVSGAGRGDDGNRTASAVQGGALGGIAGGVLGTAAPLLAQGASALVSGVRNRVPDAAARGLGLSPQSAEIVGRAIQNDDPAQALARIQAAGPQGMVADAGPSSSGLLDWSIQRAGPGGRAARDAIDQRVGAASGEIGDALDTALGPATMPTPPRYSAQTRQAYARAYASPIDYSAQPGQDIEALLPRVPGSIIQRANRLMQVEGETSAQIMAQIAPDGSVTYTQMPDVRQLDYITRALQDVARAGDGQGALGGSTAEGRAFKGLARELRDALKDAAPAYRDAVDSAATEIGIRQARDLGETALRASTTRADLADELTGMGAAELGALKKGVRTYLDDTMANVRRAVADGNMDAREGIQALRDLSSRASRQKLRMILGDQQADALTEKLDRAAKAFELRARVADNSRTFARQSMDETVKSMTEPGIVGRLLEGSPVEASRRLVQTLTRMSPAERTAIEERIAGEIAQFMTSGGGSQANVQTLMGILARQPVTARMAQRAGEIAGSATVIGGYPAATRSLETR